MFKKTAEAIDQVTANFVTKYGDKIQEKLVNTAFSIKFWIMVIVMTYSFIHGGEDGLLTGTGIGVVYAILKAYQNVQFAKNNKK